jgi:hypothetical protein
VLDTLQGLAVRRLLTSDRRALEGTLTLVKEIAAEAISRGRR